MTSPKSIQITHEDKSRHLSERKSYSLFLFTFLGFTILFLDFSEQECLMGSMVMSFICKEISSLMSDFRLLNLHVSVLLEDAMSSDFVFLKKKIWMEYGVQNTFSAIFFYF